MNVKQALERLKGARAYSGYNYYRIAPTAVPHVRFHGHSGVRCAACDELDASYKDAVDTLAWEHPASRELIESARRAGQVSHEFRAKADKKWEGSYTKRVVDAMRKHFPATFNGDTKWGIGKTLTDAAALLEDYHHTMHPIYELAAQRLAANEKLVEQLRNMGGLSNTHIHASTYEALLPSIRRMQPGDTIGQQPAQMLLAKIAQLEYQAAANDKILDRVQRAEAGELDAVKSRDEARRMESIANTRTAWLRIQLANTQTALDLLTPRRPSENLPRYSISMDHEFVETVNATPDSPRKAVHGDIYPTIVLQNVRLSHTRIPSPEARYAFKSMRLPWSHVPTPFNGAIAQAIVHCEKTSLTSSLQKLQEENFPSIPGIVATNIERLIDAKFNSRRYQK